MSHFGPNLSRVRFNLTNKNHKNQMKKAYKHTVLESIVDENSKEPTLELVLGIFEVFAAAADDPLESSSNNSNSIFFVKWLFE